MTDYKAERATERKAVKAALKAAGFNASVSHDRGSAAGWLDVKIADATKEPGLAQRITAIAVKASGRDSRSEDQRHISVTFDWGYADPLPVVQKFKVGDVVEYTNGNGVKISGTKTVTEIDSADWNNPEPRYFITPTDTPWFSVPQSGLKLAA